MSEEDVTQPAQELFREGAGLKAMRNEKSALSEWVQVLELLDAHRTGKRAARMRFRFPVQEAYLNPGRTLHGGLQAAMYDFCTSTMAIFVADFETGSWSTSGVSRNMNITYLRPALPGEVLLVDCETVHVGKRLMKCKAELRRERDGTLISTCEHDKYNVELDRASL